MAKDSRRGTYLDYLEYKGAALIVWVLIIGIIVVVSAVRNTEVDTIAKEELLNDIKSIQANNGLINLKTRDKNYTYWFNGLGEAYSTDGDTYYIYLMDGRVIYYGINEALDTQAITKKQVHFLKDLEGLIGGDSRVTKRDNGGTTEYAIKEGKGKESRDYRIEVTKDETTNNISMVQNTFNGYKKDFETNWLFDRYTSTDGWQLDEGWYQDETDKEQLLVELQDTLNGIARGLIGGMLSSEGITVSDYLNATPTSQEEILNQTIQELEALGYKLKLDRSTLPDKITEEVSTNELDILKTSILEVVGNLSSLE